MEYVTHHGQDSDGGAGVPKVLHSEPGRIAHLAPYRNLLSSADELASSYTSFSGSKQMTNAPM